MPAPQISSPFLDLRRMDCMELMAQYPDKYFELAIVDPPYGIGAGAHLGNQANRWKQHAKKKWDSSPPGHDYFHNLFRVSKNQIVWGGNYFTEYLPPKMGWIMWDKGQRDFSLADGELAWASFDKALRIFEMSRGKALAKNNEQGGRFHPTQKPVALYNWLLENYAKPGDKILDTHMGSGSIAIACHYRQHHLTACELDEDYFRDACKRIEKETRQLTFI
jgi:site-specific DNA-methyltransferase (adenine-specific)